MAGRHARAREQLSPAARRAPTRAALARYRAGGARPLAAYDSSYDPVTFVRAGLTPAIDILVRLRTSRRFFRAPGPSAGRGPRRKHGDVLKIADPATQRTPDRTATLDEPIHGQVRGDVWEHLHVQSAADAPFTLVRIDVERLPRHTKRPKPMWLVRIGGPLPDDLHDFWRWSCRRYLELAVAPRNDATASPRSRAHASPPS